MLKTIAHGTIILLFAFTALHGWPTVTKAKGNWSINLEQDHGKVEFIAIGKPSAIKIHGKGPAPRGKLTTNGEQVQGTLSFALAALDSGISMRDKHMKEKYLEVGKFPEAALRISKLSLPKPLPEGSFKLENIPFEGPLTLHGKTVPIQGTVTLARAGDQMIIDSQFGLKITDYAIEIPSFAGVTVANEVRVEVHAKAPWVAETKKSEEVRQKPR